MHRRKKDNKTENSCPNKAGLRVLQHGDIFLITKVEILKIKEDGFKSPHRLFCFLNLIIFLLEKKKREKDM